eukprot:gene3550-3997_t
MHTIAGYATPKFAMFRPDLWEIAAERKERRLRQEQRAAFALKARNEILASHQRERVRDLDEFGDKALDDRPVALSKNVSAVPFRTTTRTHGSSSTMREYNRPDLLRRTQYSDRRMLSTRPRQRYKELSHQPMRFAPFCTEPERIQYAILRNAPKMLEPCAPTTEQCTLQRKAEKAAWVSEDRFAYHFNTKMALRHQPSMFAREPFLDAIDPDLAGRIKPRPRTALVGADPAP